MNMSNYEIVGLMSGTSLDGLDITHTIFTKSDENWSFKLSKSATYEYSHDLKERLSQAKQIPISALLKLDKDFGKEMANLVLRFISENGIDQKNIDAIASHGQTVYHQPKNGFSYQIGCGAKLAFHTGIPVINDFRNKDIIAGGQGAPLVPIGEKHLFSKDADAFLNLGGFCNMTYQDKNEWKAFDISPCNLPLNKLAEQKGLEYDKNGELAKKGAVDFFLLDLLNKIPYYGSEGPKSLGTEWLDEEFYPLVKFSKSTEDNICTIVEHIAIQIANALENKNIKKVMVTGGGAFNEFLLNRIRHYTEVGLVLPSKEIINFKEAIVFGFLGALYLAKEPNTIPSATGASKEVVAGVFHLP
jgi:anhydro-N-acetylmuramic acid kinase